MGRAPRGRRSADRGKLARRRHAALAGRDGLRAASTRLGRAVGDSPEAEDDTDAITLPKARPGKEIDFGAPEGNDFERVARAHCDVRAMGPEDLPQSLRIDREITGHDRRAYIEGKLGEAMDDSAIRVSLTARLDGAIVGFLMARADLGDFGLPRAGRGDRHSISVDPGYGGRGIGTPSSPSSLPTGRCTSNAPRRSLARPTPRCLASSTASASRLRRA
jgi:hypothetical protein